MCVYLDSNVFIGAVEGTAPDAGAIRALLALADSRPGLLATSELSLAEVSVIPFEHMNLSPAGSTASRRADPAVLARDYGDLIADRPGMLLAHVDRSVLTRAAQVRAADKIIRLPDAIHVATAELCGCTHFLTADKKLLRRVKSLDVVPLTSSAIGALAGVIQGSQ
jgi:predicted nucleic acid-binding protein